MTAQEQFKALARSRATPAASAVAVAMFASAFWAASREKCEGQIEFYFWVGVGALIVLLVLPLAVRSAASIAVRLGGAVIFVVLGVGVWIAGLAAANVRLLCRLF